MNKNIETLLKSMHENGLKITLNKVIIKVFGKILIEAQKKNTFLEQKNLISAINISSKDLQNNLDILNDISNQKADIKTMNWFLPNFEHALYGGIYTILRFAAYFQEKNIQNRIIIYDNPFADVERLRETVTKEFPKLSKAEFLAYDGKLENLPECDATVATFWTSCYLSVKFNKTKKKFYFVQDYEPLFYSANSYYALTEATYRLGFKGLVNTPGLADFVRNQHAMECQEFYPCVDDKIYNISDEQIENSLKKETIDIFIYGRPNHDRNAFELALIALIELKKKYGDKINIYSAGDEWRERDYGVDGVIKNLGRLSSLVKVADLYRKCDIGLVFMFTKHPSYQPFEYMSCGCAVVTNYNESNLWFLKNGENCLLSVPTPSCIVDNVSNLIDDKNLREYLIKNGLNDIKKHEWADECERIYNYMKGL